MLSVLLAVESVRSGTFITMLNARKKSKVLGPFLYNKFHQNTVTSNMHFEYQIFKYLMELNGIVKFQINFSLNLSGV